MSEVDVVGMAVNAESSHDILLYVYWCRLLCMQTLVHHHWRKCIANSGKSVEKVFCS